MAKVRDWFSEFARHLVERSNRTDWPDPWSEFWIDFERSLVKLGASWVHADEALSNLCDQGGIYPADWRPKIIEEIRRLQKRDIEAGLTGLGKTRQDIERESRGCPECGGAGSSVRYVHSRAHVRLKHGEKVTGFCGSCSLGRFLARANPRPEVPGYQPWTWADVPSMVYRPDLPNLHHPDHWDEVTGKRIEQTEIFDFMAEAKAATAGKGPRAYLAELKRRLSSKLTTMPEEPPEETPGPSKVWRRDPGSPATLPMHKRPEKPPTNDPSVHREPPPF